MLHRTNWGALVGGVVLLTIATLFLVDALANRSTPLVAVIPLLLVGLGLAAILGRRFDRARERSTSNDD